MTMKRGVIDILYKAGLHNIACNYEKLACKSDFGTTPEKICGGAPIKLLRILNHPYLIATLYDEASFSQAKTVFRKYASYIEKLPTVGQWEYLFRLEVRGQFGGCFKRSFYNLLGKDYTEKDMDLIQRLYELSAIDNKQYKEILKNYGLLYQTEHLFKKIKVVESSIYEYQGDKYSIILPESANEIYYEGIKQNNCLINGRYSLMHLDRTSTILLLRENNRLTVPFVTLEIVEGGIIEQCYARNNTLPDLCVYQFLRNFCKNKGFHADFDFLIFENLLRDNYGISKFNSLLEFCESSDDPQVDVASDGDDNDQVTF